MISVIKTAWSRVLLERRTYQHKEHIENMRKALHLLDAMSDEGGRSKKQECPYCYYVKTNRVGGQSVTYSYCGICGKELCFGSTCVDLLCPECAKEHDLCKHCGADYKLRLTRKKPWPSCKE